jgi:hypothetical protein
MKQFLNLFYAILFIVVASFVGVSVGATPTTSLAVTAVVIVSLSVISSKTKLADGMRTGFDVSEIITQLGAYSRKVAPEIWRKIFTGLELEQYMKKVSGVTDVYKTMSSSNSEILQPFQSGFQEKGAVAFTAYENKVRQIKIDYLLQNMDDIYATYLAFMADESKSRTEWPLVKYIWENHLIPSIKEELNLLSAKGVYAAPTPGTAGSSISSTDGILTIVAREITATNLSAIVTGAVTTSNAVDKFELFNDSMDAKYREMKGIIFCSKTLETYYKRDYRNVFGLTNDKDAKDNTKLDATQKVIVGLECFEGSQRMLFTPANNLLCMYDKIMVPNGFDVQKENRDVKLLADFKRGYGFGTLEEVFVNDQA